MTTGNFYSFYGFSDTNMIRYHNTTTPWVLGLIGSTNYTDPVSGEGPCTDTPMFTYRDLENPETDVSLAWFPDIEYCDNLSMVNQYGLDMIYGVSEINNGSNQDLLFFRGNPSLWTPDDANLINNTITSNENLLHPKIGVKGDNIFIVAETDTQGIVLYRSSDKGDHWSSPIYLTQAILPPSSNPQYPDIFINQTHLVSTFIESGNLSVSISSDSGNSWATPIKLNTQNNSVVPGYSYTNFGISDQIVWTDNRNGNDDIYYYVGYIPSADLKVINFTLSKDIPLSLIHI